MWLSYILLVNFIIFWLGWIPIYILHRKLYTKNKKVIKHYKPKNSVKRIMRKSYEKQYNPKLSKDEIEKLKKRLKLLDRIYNLNTNIILAIIIIVFIYKKLLGH